MSDRISPWTIAGDALRTFRRDPAAYIPLILLAVAVDYVAAMVYSVPRGMADLAWWAPILLMVLVYPWLYRRVMHRSIQSLRGGEAPAGKLWKFVLGLLAVGFVTKLLSFVIGIFPGMVFFVWYNSPNGLGYLLLFNNAVMMILLLRFGFVLTAIAVDDRYDYALAWGLGKKHTLRMILTALPSLLSFTGVGILFLSSGGWPVPVSSPVRLLAFAANETILVGTIMSYSAWYVRLRERYEADRKGLAPAETVSGTPSSPDVGPVRNRETWEKV